MTWHSSKAICADWTWVPCANSPLPLPFFFFIFPLKKWTSRSDSGDSKSEASSGNCASISAFATASSSIFANPESHLVLLQAPGRIQAGNAGSMAKRGRPRKGEEKVRATGSGLEARQNASGGETGDLEVAGDAGVGEIGPPGCSEVTRSPQQPGCDANRLVAGNLASGGASGDLEVAGDTEVGEIGDPVHSEVNRSTQFLGCDANRKVAGNHASDLRHSAPIVADSGKFRRTIDSGMDAVIRASVDAENPRLADAVAESGKSGLGFANPRPEKDVFAESSTSSRNEMPQRCNSGPGQNQSTNSGMDAVIRASVDAENPRLADAVAESGKSGLGFPSIVLVNEQEAVRRGRGGDLSRGTHASQQKCLAGWPRQL